LDVGETWTYSCTYTVTQADIDAGSIVNTATGAAKDPHGAPVDDADSAVVVASSAPHMTVTKSASVPAVSNAGDPITYTVTVVNDGNVTLASVKLTDPRCAPVFQSGDVDGDGLLDVGETWTYECPYTVTQADMDAGTIDNTATAEATDPQGTTLSEDGSATV